MERGNVLVIGNSGVGKSTLINAVLGEEKAITGWGTEGTTPKLEIYESESIPFRVIDSIGFEPSVHKKLKAVNAIKKWSKESAKKGHRDNQINMIWFCVDGTASKLFPEAIKSFTSATSMWKNVPIIVVITKSYSIEDRDKNIDMVNNAFTKKKKAENLRAIIPVVADTYVLNDSAYAPPEGITELIDTTHKLMPEGVKAAETDIYDFILKRKRVLSQGIVGTATTAAVVVGFAPIPIADAAVLSSIEIAEVSSIAKIYDIKKDEESNQLINAIVEVGTVSAVAKAAISAIKAIPGFNLATGVINAIVAGGIVAAIGEGSIYVFEQVYTGKKTMDDIDWVKKEMEAKLSTDFLNKIKAVIEHTSNADDKKVVSNNIIKVFARKS